MIASVRSWVSGDESHAQEKLYAVRTLVLEVQAERHCSGDASRTGRLCSDDTRTNPGTPVWPSLVVERSLQEVTQPGDSLEKCTKVDVPKQGLSTHACEHENSHRHSQVE